MPEASVATTAITIAAVPAQLPLRADFTWLIHMSASTNSAADAKYAS